MLDVICDKYREVFMRSFNEKHRRKCRFLQARKRIKQYLSTEALKRTMHKQTYNLT